MTFKAPTGPADPQPADPQPADPQLPEGWTSEPYSSVNSSWTLYRHCSGARIYGSETWGYMVDRATGCGSGASLLSDAFRLAVEDCQCQDCRMYRLEQAIARIERKLDAR